MNRVFLTVGELTFCLDKLLAFRDLGNEANPVIQLFFEGLERPFYIRGHKDIASFRSLWDSSRTGSFP
jgi:hypothetical protein